MNTDSDQPVGWGILGSGHMAGHLSWVLGQVPGTRLVPGRYEALLDDPDVEVVYVALPNHLHHRWTLRAAAAGKAVLCEKPLALSAAEASEMLAAGLVVEAAMWRWQPRVRRLAAMLAQIGPVEHVEAGFTISAAGGWRLEPASGGGALYDLGGYPVGAALLAAGPVAEVAARLTGVPDLEAEVVLDHSGGASSALRVGFTGPDRQWLRVTGARGELELSGEPYTGPGELWHSDGAGTARITVDSPPAGLSGYAQMVAAVSAAVRGRPAQLPDPAQVVEVAQVLDRIREQAP